MPETAFPSIQSVLSRVLGLWVKPDVLPEDPSSLIDPDKPVLYLLEVGGIADRAALEIACKEKNLPAPGKPLSFGTKQLRHSVDVLNQKRKWTNRKSLRPISQKISQLVDAGMAEDAGELQIVPVSIYWGRAPDKESSFWRLLFTENWQFASRTRKLFTTIIHGHHTLLSFSEPLSFQTLKASGEPANILERKLARILRVHFRQRRIASLGPDQSHRRMLVNHVLADPSVRAAITREAQGKLSLDQARRKAEKHAYEIAADVSYPTVRILHRVLKRLWTKLYDGVELSGVDRIKAVADDHELVYVPCHRSHVDYLLLSYILYVQGYSLPHIAAGVNLNLPVVGGLLRKGGAFFLRRTFSGQPLYAAVFSVYLKEILQRGHALEYFVEGGRSRSGRLLPPKVGMLGMTIHAYLRDPQTPVAFVPVYFGYERLLEGNAFTNELAGKKKQKETVFALLKSLKTLKEDYGRVYVNFGEPIALTEFLDSHQTDWQSHVIDEKRPEWITPIVDELGVKIMRSINEAASVTPISLLATALLSTPHGCIDRTELIRQINVYQLLLKKAYEGTLIVVPEVNAEQLIEHGIRLGFVESIKDDVGVAIQIKTGQQAPLTYFRNNIVHLLITPALVAASVASNETQNVSDIYRSVTLTIPFLQKELFLEEEVDPETIDQTLDALYSVGLLNRSDNTWCRAAVGSTEDVTLIRLAEVVMPALERHYLYACVLTNAPEGYVEQDKLSDLCSAIAQRLSRTHGRPVNDLFDKHLHQSLITNLSERGYIKRHEDRISPTPILVTMEEEARKLLSDSVRHAILNTVQAAKSSQM